MSSKKCSYILKYLFVLLMIFAVYGASASYAQEVFAGDGMLCPIVVEPGQLPAKSAENCSPGTGNVYNFERMRSDLLNAKQEFPVSWTNECLNDTFMVSYQIESDSELLTKCLKFEPLSEGRTVRFPSQTTSSKLIKYTISADAGMEIKEGLHRATVRVNREGTNPPLSIFYFELNVVNDIIEGDIVLDTLGCGKNAEESLIYNYTKYDGLISGFDGSGYKNSKGALLQESDIAKLPTEIFQVSGVTADGNSRLLLRARIEPTQEISEDVYALFEVTGDAGATPTLETLDRSQIGGTDSLRVKFQSISGVLQATAVLLAPQSMVNDNGSYTVRVSAPEFSQFEPSSKTQKIVQPPVVLIHGLWSDAQAWGEPTDGDGVFQQLLNSGVEARTFEYPSIEGPRTSMLTNDVNLAGLIFRTLSEQRIEHDVVATKADLVGHSMGGLMARKFLYDNNPYLSSGINLENYQQGSVRYLVTIGTPHNGSPLGDFLIRRPQISTVQFDINNPDHQRAYERVTNRLTSTTIIGGHKQVFLSDDDSNMDPWQRRVINAIEDLAPSSQMEVVTGTAEGFINFINRVAPRPSVPMYCIAGNADGNFVTTGKYGIGRDWFKDYIFNGLGATNNIENKEQVHDRVFGGASDAIVAVSSALGPHSLGFISDANEVFEHTVLPENNVIAQQVIDVLRSEPDIFTVPTPRRNALSVFDKQNVVTDSESEFNAQQEEPVMEEEQASEILLVINSANVNIGDSADFRLTVPNGLTGSAILEITNGYGSPAGHPMERATDSEYTFTLDITGKMSGKWEARASFLSDTGDEDLFVSDNVSFVVIPDMNTLWGMQAVPSARRTLMVGDELSIEVLGAFDDGYDRLIQDPDLGTKYSASGGNGVVSVSSEGVVKALKVGKSVVTIRNGSLSTTLNVTVIPALESAPDPDPDPDPDPTPNSNGGGGCNAAGYLSAAFAALTLFLKRKQK